MLYRLQSLMLVLLGLLLPWHGAITVFGPELMRWWKEGLLVLLALTVLWNLKTIRHDLRPKILNLRSPFLWMLLFLLWGFGLIFVSQDMYTAAMAYRYLALGFCAMLLGYGVWKTTFNSVKNGYGLGVKLFHIFCTSIVFGVLSSTLFGLWTKFAGGAQVLSAWYSNTISSWVPGQTIPLYHQVGDFVRLQGASSGPVEYAHLAVMACWYLLFFPHKRNDGKQIVVNVFQVFSVLTLTFGIYHSGSRAALLGLGILLCAWIYKKYFRPRLRPVLWTADKWAALLLVIIASTAMLKFTFSKAVVGEIEFLNKNIVRISDSDHLSRPIEAFNMTLKSPLTGNLGELGPAARAKNLREINNDQAPIAESVPFDVAAQLGFLGLGLWLLTLICYWRWAAFELRVLLLTFAPLMLLATIFDMTPVSIIFHLILGLGLVLPFVKTASVKEAEWVFNLKRLAFRTYVEKVWGWQDPEQKGFVVREVQQGTVQLVFFESEAQATFSLVTEPHGCQLYSFYVHPEQQSKGIGSYLMTSEDFSKVLYLQVLKVNSGAKTFYERHGFILAGEDEYHFNFKRQQT